MTTPAAPEYTAASGNIEQEPDTNPTQSRHHLLEIVDAQRNQIAQLSTQVTALTQALTTVHGGSTDSDQKHTVPRYKGTKVGVRFVWRPRWLDESGLPEELGGLYPVLTALLEREDRPGKPVDVTYGQLARVVGVHPDTAKKRLSELEERGYVKVSPGSGKRPTMVTVKHPIRTPLAYDEVSWAAGGLGTGTPEGVLECLSGADKHYAELYGVELLETLETPTEITNQDGEVAPPKTEAPTVLEVLHSLRTLDPQWVGEDPTGRGENTPPSEIRDQVVLSESVSPDAHARKQVQKEGRKRREKTPAQEMEQKAINIPVQEVSEGAIGDAQLVCNALRCSDELTATRTAQIAELTRRRNRAYLWPEVLARIRRTAEGGVSIHRPGPYLCAVVLDVERSAGVAQGDGGRELAGRVLAVSPGGADGGPGRRQREDYSWWFVEDRQEVPPLPVSDAEAKKSKAVLLEVIAQADGTRRENYFDALVAAEVRADGTAVLVCEHADYPAYLRRRWGPIMEAQRVEVVAAAEFWGERGGPPDESAPRTRREAEAERRREGYGWLFGG